MGSRPREKAHVPAGKLHRDVPLATVSVQML